MEGFMTYVTTKSEESYISMTVLLAPEYRGQPGQYDTKTSAGVVYSMQGLLAVPTHD